MLRTHDGSLCQQPCLVPSPSLTSAWVLGTAQCFKQTHATLLRFPAGGVKPEEGEGLSPPYHKPSLWSFGSPWPTEHLQWLVTGWEGGNDLPSGGRGSSLEMWHPGSNVNALLSEGAGTGGLSGRGLMHSLGTVSWLNTSSDS